MTTPIRTRGRRMFLRGAGGFLLAVPFLESLLDPRRKVARADGAGNACKRFVAIGTEHGGVWQSSMYPPDATLGPGSSYAGRTIRRGALAPTVANGLTVLSPVLTAASDRLTPELVAKLNVIRGLDVPFYLAHHRGGHLGNYAENDGNGTDGQGLQQQRIPTIDQRLAWSESFYPDLATIKRRSLVIGGHGMSANWANPGMQSGDVNNITPENDSLALFNDIFVPPAEPGEQRPHVVDHVLADYQRLRQSNRRLSSYDRQRLDEHLERLDELQRKLNVTVSCGDVPTPTASSIDEWQASSFNIDPAAHRRFWQLHNDVIAAAFACDTCRIVSMRVTDIFATYAGDWHNDIAHRAHFPEAAIVPPLPFSQEVIAAAHQRVFEDVFVDLAAKLDAISDVEGRVLDNTLVQWTQESGAVTHDPIELPVVTAGGARGYFATGQYVDYRDLTKQAHVPHAENAVTTHTGLVYNQWLGTVLQSMGLSPNEYESDEHGGYGLVQLATETWYAGYQKYGSAELSVMGEPLPFLKA